jgi:hypothetical protein
MHPEYHLYDFLLCTNMFHTEIIVYGNIYIKLPDNIIRRFAEVSAARLKAGCPHAGEYPNGVPLLPL